MFPFNEIVRNSVMNSQIYSSRNWDVSKTELEVKFKADVVPGFHKARPVPFALRDDLVKGYEEGIAKGV